MKHPLKALAAALALALLPAAAPSYPNPMVLPNGATTALPLSSILGQVIDVTANGVKCDGSTDNASALAAVMLKAGPGKTVYFPPAASKCLMSHYVQIPPGTTVYAIPGTVTLAPTVTGGYSVSNVGFFTTGGGSDTTIYGLTFDGGGQDYPTAAGSVAVQSYHDVRLTIDHVTFQHTPGNAFLASNSSQSVVRNSVFTDIGNRWKTTHSAADRFQGITFTGDSGSEATNTFNAAENNLLTDIGLDAVSIAYNDHIRVVDNRCNLSNGQNTIISVVGGAYGSCTFLEYSKHALISHNDVDTPSGAAFDIEADQDVVVSDNHINGAGGPGIALVDIVNGTVRGNTMTAPNFAVTGIWLGGLNINGTCTHLSVEGNVVNGYKYGLASYGPGTMTDVWISQSNSFEGNTSGRFGAVADTGGNNMTPFSYSTVR